jgi:DNA-binding response OmpR family regulator
MVKLKFVNIKNRKVVSSMSKHVLIIDDDEGLLDALTMTFEDAGYQVSRASDGQEGFNKIQDNQPDVVISDVNMPKIDGFSLCKKVREAGNMVPFLILTSRDGEIDEALGLDLGADDYMSKPFSTRILLARIQALLRREAARAETGAQSTDIAKIGGLLLDRERMEVRYHDQLITITVSEFRLLEVLTQRPGIVYSRDRLLDLLRSDESVVGERIIDTYVRRLRRKFEEIDQGFDYIETVIGAGYRWKSNAD